LFKVSIYNSANSIHFRETVIISPNCVWTWYDCTSHHHP